MIISRPSCNFKELTKEPVSENITCISDPVVKGILLQENVIKYIEEAFDDFRGVDEEILKFAVSQKILPIIKRELGWSSIRSIKIRANDRKTFEQRYNADCHRDRHLFGGTETQQSALALMNYSAVVYLDHAVFRYFRNSSVTNGESYIQCVDVNILPGSIVMFPSSMMHQARPSTTSPSSRRRTVVIFDIENPDEDTKRMDCGHRIVMCPRWTQYAFMHKFFSEDYISNIAFSRLLTNRPYSWRYLPADSYGRGVHLIHWQITQNNSRSSASDLFNRSIYLERNYPNYVKIYDHRSNFIYIPNLILSQILSMKRGRGIKAIRFRWSFIIGTASILLAKWYKNNGPFNIKWIYKRLSAT